jgi:peroxiredoxin
MAETPSTMLPLGTPAPPIRLTDAVTDEVVDAGEAARGKKGLLVAFICNHCPYVKHVRRELVRVAHRALDAGFAVLAVNSNDGEAYPQDGPAAMRQLAREEGWRFPFLFDETQEVARAYRAACTPDLFLFDRELRLAYRGQFDDSRPSKDTPVTGASLSAAIDAVAAGRPPAGEQKPSVGCNIKWKRGNAPPWFG